MEFLLEGFHEICELCDSFGVFLGNIGGFSDILFEVEEGTGRGGHSVGLADLISFAAARFLILYQQFPIAPPDRGARDDEGVMDR